MKELKLLEYAVNIEDLAQQRALQEFTLLDVQILLHGRELKSFKVLKNLLPPNVKENNLCIIPMDKYDRSKTKINKEDDCIFAQIDENLGDGTIQFKKREFFDKVAGVMRNVIDSKIKYAIRFVPNRISTRASLNAIKKISDFGLKDFFENFNEAPFKKEVVRGHLRECDFNWCNKNISSNKEQMIAIKNIVNGSAFPYPYVIFGPPGNVYWMFY